MGEGVRDNAERSRYELDTDVGPAVADYRLSDGIMTIYHTEVPVARRGRGIGAKLVRGALEDIRHRELKVVPRCWFVRDFIDDNPEFRVLLA